MPPTVPPPDAPVSLRPDAAVPFDLTGYARLLWRRKPWLIAGAAILGATGAASGLLQERVFEASATIAVSASRLDQQSPGLVPTEAWVPLVSTAAVETQVVATAGVPEINTVSALRSAVTVRALPLSNLIRVTGRAGSAVAAAALANTYAALGVASAAALSRVDVERLQEDLKRMLDDADSRLRASEDAYDAYRRAARVELLASEVEAMAAQRAALVDVVIDLASERARMTRLERDIGAHAAVTTLQQAVVDDPAMQQAVQQKGDGGVTGLRMTRETPNPVFQELSEQLSDARSHVASLEEKRAQLMAAVGEKGSRLAGMSRFYDAESKLERLESERDLARKSYEAIAEKYQGARLAVIGRTPQLLVADAAVPVESPLPRFVAFKAVFGASAGVLLACLVVLGREAFRTP